MPLIGGFKVDINIITTVASVLLGGGILGFIQFLISRHDKKHDRMDEVLKAIDRLDKKVDILEAKGDERSAVSARVRILRFSDELLEGRRHSKDSYDQCLSDITTYEQYCDDHPKFKNNQTARTVDFIKRSYDERLEKHDFL